MRGAALVAAVGIPAYAIFMVLTTPASIIAWRASRATEHRAHFSETRGTLWSGSFRAHIDASGGSLVCERVAWQLVPARLAEGRAAFNVQLDCPGAQARAQLLRGWSDWEVRAGTAQVAARALPVFFPLVAAWQPDGTLSVNADGVRWNEREIHGPFSLEWRDASVSLTDVRPLGVFRIAAEGVGDAAKLTLTTASGPLQLEGRGEVKVAHGATVSGEARARADSASALEPLLKVMGPRRPDGARSIEVRIR